MNKLRLIIILVVVVGVLAGVMVVFKNKAPIDKVWKLFKKNKTEEVTDSSKTLATPVPVKIGKSKVGDLPIYISSSGKLEPIKVNDYSAEVDGNISLKVREGQYVQKGVLLFTIDNPGYEIAYEKALLDYKKAYIEYLAIKEDAIPMTEFKNEKKDSFTDDAEVAEIQKNVLEEMKKGNVSKERIKYRLGDEELRLKQALANYKKCKVYAPFSGVVGKIESSEGEYVKYGKTLLTLADISRLRIRSKILVKDLNDIKEGSSALVFPVVTKEKYPGRIFSVNPLIYDDNSTYAVVELDNVKGQLKPGLFCDVLLQTRVLKNQILVPKSALLVRDGKPLVFTTKKVGEQLLGYWMYVTPGEENFEYISIKEGLEKDKEIIIAGHYTLNHKAPITIDTDVTKQEGDIK